MSSHRAILILIFLIIDGPYRLCAQDNDWIANYKYILDHNFWVSNSTDSRTTELAHFVSCLSLSVIFLLATLFVYACIPELRSTMHGKCLMCYVMCLAVTNFSTAIISSGLALPHQLLLSVILTLYMGFLTSLLWSFVISFDMWCTFGKLCNPVERSFLKYNIFVYGTGVIFSGLVVFSFTTEIVTLNTNFYISGLLPISVIILGNIAMFSATAINISRAQSEANDLMKGEYQRHSKLQKDTLFLYVRLFILMGISRLMSQICWLFTSLSWVRGIAGCIAGSLGVQIFILFVCKKRVWNLLKDRFAVFAKAVHQAANKNRNAVTPQIEETPETSNTSA